MRASAIAEERTQQADVYCRWKLAELPIVNAFLILLRGKLIDGVEEFKKPLLTAVDLCCSVRCVTLHEWVSVLGSNPTPALCAAQSERGTRQPRASAWNHTNTGRAFVL